MFFFKCSHESDSFVILMSKFNNDKFKDLLTACNLAHKRVLKKELTSNKLKHIEYTTILIESFNDLSAYIDTFYAGFNSENQQVLRKHWVTNRDKLNQCFGKILHDFIIPNEISQPIILRDILKANFTQEELTQYSNSLHDLNFPSTSQSFDKESLRSETSSAAGSLTDLLNIVNISENILAGKMANQMSRLEFLNLASKTINRNYDGDPLALQAFINSLELLNDFITDDLTPTFCRFVKSKLEKRAMECVPNDVNTVQDIIVAL